MKKYIEATEKYRQLMLDALDYIWKNLETGHRAWNTKVITRQS